MANLAVLGASPLFRAGLVSLLKMMDFEKVHEGADMDELKAGVKEDDRPDVLLINVPSTKEDVIKLIDECKSWLPEMKVVFLAQELDVQFLGACFSAGADGILLEHISRDAFQKSLKLVRAGEKVFPSELATLIPSLASKNGATLDMAELHDFKLSEREIDILRCLSVGQSNKVIANNLDIAESTVKVHVKRILQKTHATNRTQAALWGASRGFASALTTAASQNAKEANRPGRPDSHRNDLSERSLQRHQETAQVLSGGTARVRLGVTERQAQSQIRHKSTLRKSS